MTTLSEKFAYGIQTNGYYKFENVISTDLLKKMQNGIDSALISSDEAVRQNYFFMAHNFDQSFVEFLSTNPLQTYVDKVLGDTCIIHSFNGITLKPSVSNPIQNTVHRDSPRFCRPYLLSLQILVMLDDFTKENGGTYVLPGSQYVEEKPTDEFFYDNALQMEGKAGDAIIFDAMLWHAGGTNRTEQQRRGLTLVYTRSFMKQQIDLTKATRPDVLENCSDELKRLFGFNARVPSGIDEFNLPTDQRLYKANQG